MDSSNYEPEFLIEAAVLLCFSGVGVFPFAENSSMPHTISSIIKGLTKGAIFLVPLSLDHPSYKTCMQ